MTYVELHCHSAYSFLDGASQPEELAARAAELGYPALALTDHDGVYGSLEFAHAAKALGVRPLTGAEVTLEGGAHVTLLVETSSGYANLCRILTRAHAGTRPLGKEHRVLLPPEVPLDDDRRAERRPRVPLGLCRRRPRCARSECCRPAGTRLRSRAVLRRASASVRARRQPTAQRSPCTWRSTSASKPWRRGTSTHTARGARSCRTRWLRSARGPHSTAASASVEATARRSCARRRRWSSALPGSIPMPSRALLDLAERLEFDLTEELGYRYPDFSDGSDPAIRQLAEICSHAFTERYDACDDQSQAEARARLDGELALIDQLGLAGFFLLHHEVLELARECALEVRGRESPRMALPPGRGRGSSVGSIVCYLTGLSHVDPIENGLSLGRFLNREMVAVPDIDLDFPRDIREKLIVRGHRALRPRARSARGQLRDVSLAGCDSRCRQGAWPASRRARAARTGHGRLERGARRG